MQSYMGQFGARVTTQPMRCLSGEDNRGRAKRWRTSDAQTSPPYPVDG